MKVINIHVPSLCHMVTSNTNHHHKTLLYYIATVKVQYSPRIFL